MLESFDIFASMPAVGRLEPDAFSFGAFARSGSIVGRGMVYVTVSAANGHDALGDSTYRRTGRYGERCDGAAQLGLRLQ